MQVPDPIDEPQAYQQHLLGLLGGDDPAVVQAATPAAARATVAGAGENLRRRPAPTEWSAFQCFAHLTDAEVVMSARYRWVLAENGPPLIGYDQDAWVDRFHNDEEESVESLLALFEALRTANLALWATTSAEDRARVGHHAERGPESLDLAFRMIAGHDRFHLRQAADALGAGRG
jgi:DinB superfamily